MSWELLADTGVDSSAWSSAFVDTSGRIYLSTYSGRGVIVSFDNGVSWSQIAEYGRQWSSVCAYNGRVFASETYPSLGGIWELFLDGSAPVRTSAPSGQWSSMCVSRDGVLYATRYEGYAAYKSVDMGTTWSQLTGLPAAEHTACTAGSDGTVYIGDYNGQIRVSINYGATWTVHPGSYVSSWYGLSLADDGALLAMSFGAAPKVYANGAWSTINMPEGVYRMSAGYAMSQTAHILCSGNIGGDVVYTYNAPKASVTPSSGTYIGVQVAKVSAGPGAVSRYARAPELVGPTSTVSVGGIRLSADTILQAQSSYGRLYTIPVTAEYSITGAKITPITSYRDATLPYLLEQYKGDSP